MLPPMRQRLIIAAAVAVGAIAWLAASPPLRAADGSVGLSLTTARVGLVLAVPIVVVAGLPAALAALVASASGNPLSGVFAAATSLCVLAGRGGSISGWVYRADARLPDDFAFLIVEMVFWSVYLVAVVAGILFLRDRLRDRVPVLAFDKRAAPALVLGRNHLHSVAACLLCALIAGILLCVLLRSIDGGQIVWALILAFVLAAVVTQMIVPTAGSWAVLLSPAVVAVVAYAWVLLRFDSEASYLQAWIRVGRTASAVPGPALALPIHYASAGVVGCTIGLGWAQSLIRARAHGGG